MKQPLVSIIVPTYNRADFLPETLESIVNQDYPNVELLVLDDGSKDNTKEVVAKYAPHAIYLRHDNMGETKTVNRGYSLAKGDITCVINSDDPFYKLHAISTAVKYLEMYPDALAAYSDWALIDERGNLIRETRLPLYTLERMLLEFNCALGPAMFIRREGIEKIGVRNESLRYTGDLDMSFRLAAISELVHIPQLLGTHRVHPGAVSSTENAAKIAEEVVGLIRRHFSSGNVRWYLLFARARCLSNAHNEMSKNFRRYSRSFFRHKTLSFFYGILKHLPRIRVPKHALSKYATIRMACMLLKWNRNHTQDVS